MCYFCVIRINLGGYFVIFYSLRSSNNTKIIPIFLAHFQKFFRCCTSQIERLIGVIVAVKDHAFSIALLQIFIQFNILPSRPSNKTIQFELGTIV